MNPRPILRRRLKMCTSTVLLSTSSPQPYSDFSSCRQLIVQSRFPRAYPQRAPGLGPLSGSADFRFGSASANRASATDLLWQRESRYIKDFQAPTPADFICPSQPAARSVSCGLRRLEGRPSRPPPVTPAHVRLDATRPPSVAADSAGPGQVGHRLRRAATARGDRAPAPSAPPSGPWNLPWTSSPLRSFAPVRIAAGRS